MAGNNYEIGIDKEAEYLGRINGVRGTHHLNEITGNS